MKIEESFAKALTEIQRKFPVLKQNSDCKVAVRVSSIIGIARAFHAKGWSDNDFLGILGGLGDRFR